MEAKYSETQSQKMLSISLSAGCLSCSKYKLRESSGIELRGRKIRLLSKARKYFIISFTDPLPRLGEGTDRINVYVHPQPET